MKKIWIALLVIAMLTVLCTLGMITVFAEEVGQEPCLHESKQNFYNNDEHWEICTNCGKEWHESHTFGLIALDDERHALKCECGRVLSDSIDAHAWVLTEGEDHLSCSECGKTTTGCVYDQVTYYNDAYHTFGCICGKTDPNGAMETHVVDMTKLQYDDAAHWYGCDCGYGVQQKAEHVLGEAWVTDGTHHWKECVDCGAKSALAAHSGGTATCQVDAVCAECGTSYEADAYTHVSDTLVFSKNNTHHSAVYACCGEIAVSLERHTCVDGVCTACGYACTHDIVIDGAIYNYVSTGNDTHIVVCRNCQLQVEKACYGGVATCVAKAVCDDCKTVYGKVDPTNHVDLNTWAEDLTHHWRVCTENNGCLQMVENTKAEHTWNEGVCTECEYECPHNEDGLKYVANEGGLTHDQVCTNCQSVMINDEEHLWGTDVLSGVCTICEYQCQHKESDEVSWMKWHNTDDHHKYICDECQWEDAAKEGDCAGGTATCMAKAVCETCQLEYDEKNSTNHVDTNTWVTDANGHKKVCTVNGCNQEIVETAGTHVWDNKDGICPTCKYECQVEATYTPLDGGLTHSLDCKVCGKVEKASEDHIWDENGKCTGYCEYQCAHVEHEKLPIDEKNHKEWCKVCHYIVKSEEAHNWDETGKCTDCQYQCAHKDAEENSWMKWSNDNNAHKSNCENCGWEDTEKAGNCTGGTATCVAEAVCETCKRAYGLKDENNHVDETWTIEADGHSAACDATKGGCGATLVKKVAHTWVDGICEVEKCRYECKHDGEMTTVENTDTDTHDVTCKTCNKLLVDDGAHTWKVDDADVSKSKCEVCAAACDHMNGETSLKSFSNAAVEGVWMHKSTCSRCAHVDQAGACAVGENGKEATCVARAECEICQLVFGEIDADNHDWDATTGECVRVGCDVVCQHTKVTITDDQDADNQNNKHTTTCDECKYEALADCYGNEGTATCLVKAVCAGCSASYGQLDPTKHDEAKCLANLEFSQDLNDPDYATTHNVKYPCQQPAEGDAVLVKENHVWNEGICSKCGYICTSPNLVVEDDGVDNGQHRKKCETCGHVVLVNCSGGESTCLKRAVCKDCNAAYGAYGENHDDACVRSVAIIPNNMAQHHVYYTCKTDPVLEDHYIDPTEGVCECGWHVQAPEQDSQEPGGSDPEQSGGSGQGSAVESNMVHQGLDSDLTAPAEEKRGLTAMIVVLCVVGLGAVTVTCVTVGKKKKDHN
ncbi:MAG: hypothetical protein J6B09_04045 [Clostridia bacterium]|nr:hypothetical protein [Clostridia bacterium]